MSRAIGLLLLLAACGDNARLRPDASFPDDAAPDVTPPDTTAPDTTITEAPPAAAISAMATFAFTGSDADDHFECAVDDTAFAACSSPASFTVADGAHRFQVRAIDRAGNIDASPAAFAWTVDTQAPDTLITEAPPAAAISAMATFAFTGSDAGDRFECTVDDGAFAACTSPATFTVADGAHRFQVRAIDEVGNIDASPAAFAWTVDTQAPDTMITEAPPAASISAMATFAFTGSDAGDRFECALDAAAFAACTSPVTLSVADGAHSFQVRAIDEVGNTDASPATFAWTVDTQPAVCGDSAAHGTEVCDGADLRGATCASLGHAPGTLACAADCTGYDATACTGNYDPANTGFTGRVCFNGLKFSTPNLTLPYVVACTEDAGVFKTTLASPVSWSPMNASGITNLRGRGIATNPNGPPIYYISDASTTMNGFRSNNQGTSWTAQSISDGTAPRELFAFSFRAPIQNLAGSWDPVMGAVVLHGNAPGLVPHFVGPAPGSVMGTPHAFANGGASDVYVAVYGKTPGGQPATGGIFRACDLTSTGGGTYEERDTGLAPSDTGRVWSLTVDPASITGATFACGASTAGGYAATYYAALRGGGQVYKTGDGGLSWQRSNTGLPPGAEVYDIAIDCFNPASAAMCQDRNLLFAATSAGLYRSTDAGATWKLDGFEGKVVRAVTVDPQPAASAPRVLVGVEDMVGIYQSR